jgi:hypothetical protein
MPISRHARITRTAISPRLAIKIFLNILGLTRQLEPQRAALDFTCASEDVRDANHRRL